MKAFILRRIVHKFEKIRALRSSSFSSSRKFCLPWDDRRSFKNHTAGNNEQNETN